MSESDFLQTVEACRLNDGVSLALGVKKKTCSWCCNINEKS